MAVETLRIDITADNKAAIASLKQTEQELKKTASQAMQTGSAVAKGSNQAAFALTNLGRIAQDAPFGFIGIQNNLNPMLESFQRLQKETGSAGSALKAMAGSLIGPAGLGLALSVGGALLVTFGDELSDLLGITFGLTKEQKELNKAIDGFKTSAAEEIIKFKELTSVASNANVPLKQRKEAVKELQQQYPAYLDGLSQEDILSGKIGGAYDKIVEALKAKIALQAAEQRLIPIIKEQLDVAEKLADAQKKINALQGIGAKELKDGERFAAETGKINPFKGLQAKAIAAKAEIEKLSPVYNELENKIKSTFNSMQPFIAASNGLNFTLKDQKEGVDELKKSLDNYIKTLLYERALQKQGMRNVNARTVLAGDYSNPEVNIPQSMVERQQTANKATKTMLDYNNALRLTAQNEQIAAAGAAMATSAFSSLGQAMLQGQGFGDALANTFKRLLVDLTQMVVKAMLFKAIMASLTGGTSAVAGAAGGGGGFLGNLFKGLLGFADGGVVSGPKSGYPVMLHGTEAVLNPKQFKTLTSNMMNLGAMQSAKGMQQSGDGQFVLRGNDLVLALQRSNYALNLRRG